MEVTIIEKKACKFRNIHVGDCFVFNDHVHLAIRDVPSNEYKHYNAVDLEFNEAKKMDNDTEVYPVEASMKIKYQY